MLGLAKFIVPEGTTRDRVRKLIAHIAETWIAINNAGLSLYSDTQWDLDIPPGLDRNGCYIVTCNHQTWVDIPVLQRSFHRELPLLRFFLKSQLIWVPFLGLAWWALEFPFMRRYSREEITRRPELKGRDLENARKACEKFRNIPVAMMSFPEGTRFSSIKRRETDSPYQRLLRPRTGGIGQVLYALAEPLDALVDVTIAYEMADGRDTAPTLWQLVSGQVRKITVRAGLHDIPAKLRGANFRTDTESRRALEDWLNQLWHEKDELLQQLPHHGTEASGKPFTNPKA